MPRLERIITVNLGESVIVKAGSPLFLSAEQEEQKESVLARAAASIQENAQSLHQSLSGAFEDVEQLRTELGPDFAYLSRRLAEYLIDRPELTNTLSAAVISANCDAFTKRLIVHKWLKEFDSFLASLPQDNGNGHLKAA